MATIPKSVICPTCGESCSSQRGLSMHRHHHHPEEVNEERLAALASKRLKWTPEDDATMIQSANQFWKEGMEKKTLVEHLCQFFPTRSREAVRKRLQLIKWTPPSSSAPPSHLHQPSSGPSLSPSRPSQQEQQASHPSPSASGASPQHAPSAPEILAWRSALLEDCITSMQECKLGAVDLRDIAKDLSAGAIDLPRAAELLETHATLFFPHQWKPSRARPTKIWSVSSNKQRRRANYAAIQRLYHRRRKDAASTILSGKWRNAYQGLYHPVDGLDAFWSDVFSTSSVVDNTASAAPPSVLWSVIRPITAKEVTTALRSMGNTATGLDRVSPKDLLLWDQPSIAAYFNLLLAAEYVPVQLSMSRVAFLPKVDEPSSPSDFRPISISSCVLRALHKILARRLTEDLNLSWFQFAFLQKDGCLEASTLLHTCLRKAHDETLPLSLLFLDIAKAFDTISHDTVLRVARTSGLPPPLTNYLRHLYSSSAVKLDSGVVQCGRGVRQGDPLSPLLFIMAMDVLMKDTVPECGFQLGDTKIGALAYADDLILLANDPASLQRKFSALLFALQTTGMTINSKKCRGLTILKDRRRKCLVLAPKIYLTGSDSIQPIGVTDQVRYLGIMYDWKGRIAPRHTNKLQGMLREISEAPLKPYQRLDLLRTFVVPKLTYELTLGSAHRNTLLKLDVLLRNAVRRWLRLPKDTPVAFLHAPINDGGLGVPCLSSSIPLAQKSRYIKLLNNAGPLFEAVRAQKSFNTVKRLLDLPCRVGSSAVSSKAEVKEAWRDQLHQSADGRELDTPSLDPASHNWLKYPARVFPRLHLRGIQLRGGVLPTKARNARGVNRSTTSTICQGACRQTETINHILQKCERTHDHRCARHNRVVRKAETFLRRKGGTTWVEPVMPAGQTFIKPDIVLLRGRDLYIMDVTIVSGTRMSESWDLKVRKYGSPTNIQAIQNWLTAPATIHHLPIVISSRGLMFGPSGRGLRSLGLIARDIMDLCLLTIMGSLRTFDFYTRGQRAV